MTEKVFNYADVVQAVAQIVLDRGADYVDPHSQPFSGGACSYVQDGRGTLGAPCVVGEFWARQGVDEDTRESLDRHGTILSVALEGLLPVLVTERAFVFLRSCQRSQDMGAQYGRMLALSLTLDTATYNDIQPITREQVLVFDEQY